MQGLLDLRDNRGKRHEQAFVLYCFLFSMLRIAGDITVSSVHRMMKREYLFLAAELGLTIEKCISRSQLGRLLELLDFHDYNRLNEEFFGAGLDHGQDGESLSWYAIDGKELRGSIDKAAGQKRAENIVRMVSHRDSSSNVIFYYDGSKRSEKALVKQYFKGGRPMKDAYSMDALHTDTDLLTTIHQRGGTYLAQVKGNQKHMLEACRDIHSSEHPHWKDEVWEKGHGRIEMRKGYHYRVVPEWFADSWKDSGISNLIVVERKRHEVKTGKESGGTYFYISNRRANIGNGQKIGKELFEAVRKHWGIEADHYVRDKVLGEDDIKCFNKWRTRALAAVINVAVNLIRIHNDMESIKEFREEMNYDRRVALKCLK